jgi:hypothetical protein
MRGHPEQRRRDIYHFVKRKDDIRIKELWGRHMAKTHDYQIINDTAPAIETALTTQAVEGWRPILMSIATVNTAVQVTRSLIALRLDSESADDS